MTKVPQMVRPWDTVDYQRIVSASYRDGEVVVEFADGTEAQLSPGRLVSPTWPELDWANLRAEEFHIVVPSPAGEFEIPWDVIRVQSDPAYDKFWSELVDSVAVGSRSRDSHVG